jgi:hypothetical protein
MTGHHVLEDNYTLFVKDVYINDQQILYLLKLYMTCRGKAKAITNFTWLFVNFLRTHYLWLCEQYCRLIMRIHTKTNIRELHSSRILNEHPKPLSTHFIYESYRAKLEYVR